MKKLLLSLAAVTMSFVSFASSVYTLGDAVPNGVLTEGEHQVIFQVITKNAYGFLHSWQNPSNSQQVYFGCKDVAKTVDSEFDQSYVYTLNVAADGSFTIKNSKGGYAPGTATSSTSTYYFSDTTAENAGSYTPLHCITTESIKDEFYMLELSGDPALQVHLDGTYHQWTYLTTGDAGKQDAGGVAGTGNTTRTACAFKMYYAVPQIKQVTNETVATDIVDGAIITLQCKDNNGGYDYYFNGAGSAKTATLQPTNLFKVVAVDPSAEIVQSSNAVTGTTTIAFYLQQYTTGKYVGKSGDAVSAVDTKEDAAQFVAYIPKSTLMDSWTTKPEEYKAGVNTIRFETSSTYLNCQPQAGTPKYAAGKGGYSYWFVNAYSEAEAEEIINGSTEVVFTFPAFGGQTLTMTIEGKTNVDAATIIPAVPFFTATGVEGDNVTVTAENTEFTVTGNWTFPFNNNEVYRIDIRKKAATDAGTCSNLLYNAATNQVDTRVVTDADAFVPERLFYLDAKGFTTEGNLKATLHTIAVDANKGLQVATPNQSKGIFTETPIEFLVVTNSTGSEGVSLRHPDNAICHINDINGFLSIWNHANSQNDVGSFLRFGELTDSDFDSLLSGELADYITTDMLTAAKASKSAADVRALFNAAAPYLEAVAEAEALLAGISGYTAEHFGEGLGYFSGTTYEAIFALVGALQETLEGVDVEAITAATEALAAEVAKVQVNVPVAGKFYRIQNYAADAYLVGGAEVMIAKFESVDVGAPNSIFYFTGDKLVSYTTGLYLANFDRDNNGKMFLGYTNVNGADAGTSFTFKVASPGKFNVVYNGSRYLYSAGAGNVNAGSDVTTSSTGYQNYCFTLTEVEWLPIAIDEEFGWTTLYSPVQLGFNDRVKAYVGTVNAEDPSDLKFVVTELTEAIPANVGVLVQLLEGAQVDNGCVYLPVEESTVTDVTSDLTGSFEKVAVASGVQVADASEIVKSHFVFEKKSDELNGDFGEFNKNDVDDLAAFAAHLEVDNASDETITIADSEGNNPTGIEEIAVESEKVQGIYDLQGRRLSAPVKGINIINGKKVLVK